MGLQNNQYDELLRQYDSRRLHAHYVLNRHKEEVYNKCPEILDIDNQIAEQSLARGRMAIMGDSKALEGLDADNRALNAKKQNLLVSLGYPADYLTLSYTCPACKDTGYIDGMPCTCFKAAVSKLVYEASNIRDIIEDQNFDNFDFSLYSDSPESFDSYMNCTPYGNIVNIVNQAKSFVANFGKEYKNLLIYGHTGVGKTYLTNCIARELLDSAHTVQYYTAFRFFEYLADCRFRPDKLEEGSLGEQAIIDCDLLIIDDLGTEISNTFTASALYSIVNERHLKKHPTIISTNISFSELESRYSERVYSRICKEYDFLRIFGADIRRS